MTTAQGDVKLLEDPIALHLLQSRQLARLSYTWHDGTPRVVPLWFQWTGTTIAFGTPIGAPKVKVLEARPEVAVSIDDATAWPYRALLVRGQASVHLLDDVAPEYAEAAVRYFGPEQGEAWLATLRGQPMARILVTPTWVAVLDFETRFRARFPAEFRGPVRLRLLRPCRSIPRKNSAGWACSRSGRGAIRFWHLGDLREHVAFRVRLVRAPDAARVRLQLVGAAGAVRQTAPAMCADTTSTRRSHGAAPVEDP